ncbi:MAG: HDOD domain-containing protein [Spirochaetales bacterium]
MTNTKIQPEKVQQAVRSSIPLTIKSYKLPHETETQLEEILEVFLKEIGQESIKDALAYCLRELAVNAKKANTKRVYFEEMGLDIYNDADYERGMKSFKEDTLSDIDRYLELQKESGLYVKVIFHFKGRVLNLYVVNNAAITRREQMRVYDRIARSRAYESLEEALTSVLDDSEGAGLGIVILVLMLKKMGLDEESFDIDVKNNETVAKMRIPMSEVHAEALDSVSAELSRHIDSLPRFPENITQIQKMISDPDSDLHEIGEHISTDPALTADLLKVVNSAQFMLPKRVDSIFEAVKLVGMRGLRNLLYSYGTQQILGSDTAETRELWQHSYQTGFYAYYIARHILKDRDLLDDVYAGGILHDMGKIVFSSVHPELINQIEQFCKLKGLSTSLLEDLASGLNHAEIGALVAEKWNFPEPLIEAIGSHHNPSTADPVYRNVVGCVYLANALCDRHSQHVTIEYIEPGVRERFGVKTNEQLYKLKRSLEQAFKRQAR